MVPLTALWLPILLSAVIVFIASSIIHMFLGYHAGDYAELPNESAVREALRPLQIPPGDYSVPHAHSSSAMSDPEHVRKLEEGPVGFMTFAPTGQFSMGRSLGLWFLYCVIISFIVAYITGRALAPTPDYANVFQIAGATAFAAYGFGRWQHAIWYYHGWGSTLKSTFDGLIYAALTAGTFGWLWPGG